MRVLLINQVFHPDPQATGQYLTGLAQGLVKRGHKVTVLTSRRSYDDPARSYPASETWRGIEIVRVWNPGFGHATKWHRILDFLAFLVSAGLRALLLQPAEVIVALTTPPLLSALGAGLAAVWRARFIYWVMDLNPDEAIAVGWLRAGSAMARLLESLSRWSLRQADWVITLDDYMRERVVAKGIATAQIVTVPIWMHDAVRFDPAGRERFRHEHKWQGKFVVMYSGNHTPVHPLETLVEAAALLRDVAGIHFCLAGGGIEWRRLRALVRREAWPNVTFCGYEPFDTLSASLSAADVQVVVMGDGFVGIVHPSKVYNFLAVERPFVFIGREKGHVPDLIRATGLAGVASSFRHGQSLALAEDLRRRADEARAGVIPIWPVADRFARWTEAAAVGQIVALVENPRVRI